MHKNQIQIIDLKRLRSVLRSVYRRSGTQQRAAERLGIGRYTFRRLFKGKPQKRVRVSTFRAIRDGLRGDALGFEPDEVSKLTERLSASVLTEAASHAHQQYKRWLREECRRLMPKVNSVLAELFSHPTYPAYLKGFLVKQYGSRELPLAKENPRGLLVLLRALEPLADAGLTWGVERSWREMDEIGHLGTFLRVALERERIMLDRERDITRLNKCELPAYYVASLAIEEYEPTDRVDPKSEFTEYVERPEEDDQG